MLKLSVHLQDITNVNFFVSFLEMKKKSKQKTDGIQQKTIWHSEHQTMNTQITKPTTLIRMLQTMLTVIRSVVLQFIFFE